MSVQCEVSIKQAAEAPMGLFERWLMKIDFAPCTK